MGTLIPAQLRKAARREEFWRTYQSRDLRCRDGIIKEASQEAFQEEY